MCLKFRRSRTLRIRETHYPGKCQPVHQACPGQVPQSLQEQTIETSTVSLVETIADVPAQKPTASKGHHAPSTTQQVANTNFQLVANTFQVDTPTRENISEVPQIREKHIVQERVNNTRSTIISESAFFVQTHGSTDLVEQTVEFPVLPFVKKKTLMRLKSSLPGTSGPS